MVFFVVLRRTELLSTFTLDSLSWCVASHCWDSMVVVCSIAHSGTGAGDDGGVGCVVAEFVDRRCHLPHKFSVHCVISLSCYLHKTLSTIQLNNATFCSVWYLPLVVSLYTSKRWCGRLCSSLVANTMRISHAKFHCSRLTSVQDIHDYESLIFCDTV